jgi:hypothetical protein
MHSIEVRKQERTNMITQNAICLCVYVSLCLDLVFAAEHVVYGCEVIGT